MISDNLKDRAETVGTGVQSTNAQKAEQSSAQTSSVTADDKSSTKRESPRALAGKNWQTYLDVARKMTESEHMALIALLQATIQPEGASLSELGRNAVNYYLDEGAATEDIKSSLELGRHRIQRAKHFFDKKPIGDAKKERMQNLLLELAYDVAYIEERFEAMQTSGQPSSNRKQKGASKQ